MDAVLLANAGVYRSLLRVDGSGGGVASGVCYGLVWVCVGGEGYPQRRHPLRGFKRAIVGGALGLAFLRVFFFARIDWPVFLKALPSLAGKPAVQLAGPGPSSGALYGYGGVSDLGA